MTIEFIKDSQYREGIWINSRKKAKVGDVRNLDSKLAQRLIEIGVAIEVKPKPTPTHNKATQPTHSKYKFGEKKGSWQPIVDEEGNIVEKIQGDEEALQRLKELNANV